MKNESEEMNMLRKTIVTLALISFIGQGCADTAISADTARIQDLAALQDKLDKLEKVLTKLQTQSNGHARLLTDVSDSLTQVAAVVANHNSALKDPDKLRKRAWDSNGKALGHLLMKKQGNVVTIDHPEYGPIDLDLDDEGISEVIADNSILYYTESDCQGVPKVKSYEALDGRSGLSAGDILVSRGKTWRVTALKHGSPSLSVYSTWTVSQLCVNETVVVPGVFYDIEVEKSLPVFSGPITLD